MIFYKKGDILEAKEKIIVQQVNCFAKMGAGLAKQLKDKWPELEIEYVNFCRDHKDPVNCLGKVFIFAVDNNRYVANVFGQFTYGRNKHFVYTSYGALAKGLAITKQIAQDLDIHSVAIPNKIGCGLANGNWEIVKMIIKDVFTDVDAIVYEKE